ncbi:unnamed protein product [Heterobilharzia americana]|nr:unnamed protein product [Heterobilharzia americana]CAH8432927.1 unnamed protein product [Heterobilharzia americana]
MNDHIDFRTHVGVVNQECEQFRLKTSSDDQFKSLILICSFHSPKFCDIRTRLLSRLDQDPKLTLNRIADEFQCLETLRHDAIMVQSDESNYVYVVRQSSKYSSSLKSGPTKSKLSNYTSSPCMSDTSHDMQKISPSPCWLYGAGHYTRSSAVAYTAHNTSSLPKKNWSRNYSRPTERSMRITATFVDNGLPKRKFLTVSINN